MDHNSELEGNAGNDRQVFGNAGNDRQVFKEVELKVFFDRKAFKEVELKDLKQISIASLDHAGDFESPHEVFSVLVFVVRVVVILVQQLRSNSSSSKRGHLSSSSHTGDVSPKGRDHHNQNRASMQKASPWITAVTFPGCLLLSNYRPYSSLCNVQRSSFSIWLPLLGMLNFTAFLSSLFLMVICGAHFTRLHVISALLLISFFFTSLNYNKWD